MIEVTIGHIRSHQYQNAWAKVLQAPLSGYLTYQIMKLEKAIQHELEPALTALEKVAKTLGDVDALKNYQIREENKKQWTDEMAKVNEIQLKIDRPKLSMQELDKVNLSALDLLSLEFMLHELELVPGGEDGKDEEKRVKEKA